MSAIEKAREIVKFIEIMDQNGLYFFNTTLKKLSELHQAMKEEVDDPPQNRGAEREESWTHSLCQECWVWINPDREPVALKPEYANKEICCLCGRPHKSGIYIRRGPDLMPCRLFPFPSIHNKPKKANH